MLSPATLSPLACGKKGEEGKVWCGRGTCYAGSGFPKRDRVRPIGGEGELASLQEPSQPLLMSSSNGREQARGVLLAQSPLDLFRNERIIAHFAGTRTSLILLLNYVVERTMHALAFECARVRVRPPSPALWL